MNIKYMKKEKNLKIKYYLQNNRNKLRMNPIILNKNLIILVFKVFLVDNEGYLMDQDCQYITKEGIIQNQMEAI